MTVLPAEHLRAIKRTSERHENRDGFICLDRNERASPIPDAILRDMLAQVSARDLMAYPDAGPFVSRLSRVSGMPEDFIAETAGSDAALRRLFMAYLNPGDVVVSLRPSYAMYDLYTRILQGVSRQIDYRAGRSIDVEELLAAIDDEVRLVILAHPDQPIGTALDAGVVRRVVERTAAVGAVCLLDEAYYPFYPVTLMSLVREFDNLIVTRSFSKYPGCAGLRLGWAVAQKPLIEGLMSVRGGNEVSGVSLSLGCYLLDHPAIAEEFRLAVEEGRRLLVAGAQRAGLEPLPCVTNFQHLRCPSGISPEQLAELLKARRYLVKTAFSHPALADCVRVSLNGPDIMAPFTAVLEETVAAARAGARAGATA